MDDAEARAILREHGHETTERGKLSKEDRALADSYRADGPGPDYDQNVSEADFAPEPDSVTVAAEPPALPPERAPRRVRKATPTIRERIQGARGKKKPAKKHPRVSVAPLISEAWAVMGGIAQRIDRPVGTCLIFQSAVAGPVLEDIVKGTVADRALQPLARAEDKAKAVAALAGPPMLVAAIEHAQTLPEPQRKAREAILLPMLVQSLMLWDRIAAGKAEELMARAEAESGDREKAEAMVAMIFGQAPAQPVTPEPATAGV